jgi:predicted Fe-S protein YdhL (DUF1289 family)
MTVDRSKTELLLEQAERVRDMVGDLPSPCMNVCRMDEPRVLCLGCLRTLDEIRAWRALDDAGKRVVWARIAQRAQLDLSQRTSIPRSEVS